MGRRLPAEQISRGDSEHVDELKLQTCGNMAPPARTPEWVLALVQPQ
jgi:hypothetical protein